MSTPLKNSQNGNLPQFSGWKKTIFELPPPSIISPKQLLRKAFPQWVGTFKSRFYIPKFTIPNHPSKTSRHRQPKPSQLTAGCAPWGLGKGKDPLKEWQFFGIKMLDFWGNHPPRKTSLHIPDLESSENHRLKSVGWGYHMIFCRRVAFKHIHHHQPEHIHKNIPSHNTIPNHSPTNCHQRWSIPFTRGHWTTNPNKEIPQKIP